MTVEQHSSDAIQDFDLESRVRRRRPKERALVRLAGRDFLERARRVVLRKSVTHTVKGGEGGVGVFTDVKTV